MFYGANVLSFHPTICSDCSEFRSPGYYIAATMAYRTLLYSIYPRTCSDWFKSRSSGFLISAKMFYVPIYSLAIRQPVDQLQPSQTVHSISVPHAGRNIDRPSDFVQTSEPNSHPYSMRTREADSLSRLADLLSERQIKDKLPLPEPEMFRGDLMHFLRWLKSFETIVEGQTKSNSERLFYIGKYTAGEAKEAISGYLCQDNTEAFQEAKNVPKKRFGNPFLVANSFKKKISDWPKVLFNDGIALRKYSDFLNQALSAMKSSYRTPELSQ